MSRPITLAPDDCALDLRLELSRAERLARLGGPGAFPPYTALIDFARAIPGCAGGLRRALVAEEELLGLCALLLGEGPAREALACGGTAGLCQRAREALSGLRRELLAEAGE